MLEFENLEVMDKLLILNFFPVRADSSRKPVVPKTKTYEEET